MTMPDRPLSREEEYLASIAGQDGVKPDRPLSRKEEYLDAIDSHLDTKADLVDGKIPASELPSYVDDVVEGYYHDSKFYEDDQYTEEITPESSKIYVDLATGYTYRWGGTEYVQIGGGASQPPVKVLTEADKNYPENNPTSIVLSKLPDGIYVKGDSTNVYVAPNSQSGKNVLQYSEYATVAKNVDNNNVVVYIARYGGDYFAIVDTDGNPSSNNTRPSSIMDRLNSTSSSAALSANQGKVLKDTIDNRIRVESTAPTTSTSGALGQLWIDNTGPTIYILSNISGSTYTWTNLMA